MTEEALRREPFQFEVDIPYADTDNPRYRLDLYLPKRRESEKPLVSQHRDLLLPRPGSGHRPVVESSPQIVIPTVVV